MQTSPIPVTANHPYRPYEPLAFSSGSPSKLRLILPLSAALIAGTGGVYGAANVSYAASIVQNPIIVVRGHQPRREYLMSVAQQVMMIRDLLGLKMSEIAQIFGVTRPTAYAWLDGSEPKPDIKSKIHRVRRLVDDLRSVGIVRIDLFARLPLASGKSLVDSLRAGSGIEDAAAAVKRTAHQQEIARSANIERGRGNRKRLVSLDEISTVSG